jgi:hypothetical protein
MKATLTHLAGATLLVTGCLAWALAAAGPVRALADGELRFAESASVTSLMLDNGAAFHFVEVEPGSVGVLEEVPREARGIASLRELRELSIAELYHALSEQGSLAPPNIASATKRPGVSSVRMVRQHDRLNEARPQGWARALLSSSTQARSTSAEGNQALAAGICDDDTFMETVQFYGYNDRDTPRFRLNRKPNSLSNFVKYAEPIEGANLTFYRYTVGGHIGSLWSNVDRFVSIVAVCAIDTHEPSNPGNAAHPAYSDGLPGGFSTLHWGPSVRFSYRKPGGSWQSEPLMFKDFAASEVGKSYGWHFYTGLDWDWLTEIQAAGGDDRFDIGHAVEDL